MPSEERLHPASILFSFGKSLKAFAVPGLVGLFIAARQPGPSFDGWLMVLLVPAALVAVVRYLSFHLRYEPTELVIRSGIIFRNERHIPYARIQNLDAVQNVFHRLLRVIEVRIETGGGNEPEATISVLPARALDEMRSRVFGHLRQADDLAPAAHAPVLLALPFRELLLHGFLVNRGMVVIGALYGLLWELGLMERFWGPGLRDELEREGSSIRALIGTVASGRTISLLQIGLAVAGIAGFLIVVRAVSMAWAVIRLYGFRLTKHGEDLRMEYGLFTRVTATIPVRRIQTLTIREGPLYRVARRVSVRVETAGGRAGQEGAATTREWLAPLIRPAALPALIAEVLPEYTDGDPRARSDWQPPAPRAFRRAVKPRLFAASLTCIPAALIGGWWAALYAAAILPWSVHAASKYVRHLGWVANDEVVLFKSGWLWRSTSVARVSRIQAVSLRESPFDRRHAMARVRVDTAGAGERSHRIDIPYLPRDRAAALQLRLAAQAADTAFHW
jgi:putative membrane protein